MKIIQAAGWYFPDSVGGTEVYLDSLVAGLRKHGIECVIAAPRNGLDERHYVYHDAPVYRYPVFPERRREQIRGQAPHGGFEFFRRWLEDQRAVVYHQHSTTFGCNLHHLRLAKEFGMSIVVTIHLPGSICLRGTMMLHGQTPCDGRVDGVRCGACWNESKGVPTIASGALARIPMPLSRAVMHRAPILPLTTAASTPALVAAHRHALLEAARLADRVVVVCQWLYDAMRINGVPREKLVLCRQGAPGTPPDLPKVKPGHPHGGPFKIGFLGRLTRGKGVHILIEAVRRLPKGVPVELVIHGARPQGEEKGYQEQLLREAERDGRIRFTHELSREEIHSALAILDVLAVPSQWLETGPMVILEAQAAGIPVLGSHLGGIAELVQHGVNGWLLPATDVEAWSEAIARLARERHLLSQLREGTGPVRTMDDVASEMAAIYRDLTSKGGTPPMMANRMRHVAIVSPHFVPSNLVSVHRARYLAMHLPEFGWQPTIVTVDERHYEEALDHDLLALLPPNLEIRKGWAFPTKPFRWVGDIGIRGFLGLFHELWKLHRGRPIDFLYITIPSNFAALLGPLVSKRLGIPYGIDYQDPWVHGTIEASKPLGKAWASLKLAKLLEPWVLRHTSLVTGVAPSYYAEALARNSSLRHTAIAEAIPFGWSTRDYDCLDRHPRAPDLFHPDDGRFHMVYAGAMLPMAYPVLEILLRAIAQLVASGSGRSMSLRLHFIGTGRSPNDSQRYTIKPYLERYGLSQWVDEHPQRIGYLDVLNHLRHASAILILGSVEPHYTPSKVFQAILSERPVFALLHQASEAVKLLRDVNVGPIVTFDEQCLPSVSEVAGALQALLIGSYPARTTPNRAALEPFSARTAAKRLAGAIDQALLNAHAHG